MAATRSLSRVSGCQWAVLGESGNEGSAWCGQVEGAKVLEDTGTHGWFGEAFREECRNLQRLTEFESCETSFRHSKSIRQGGVEAPTLWMKLATLMK